jgi:uncharacterized protein (DUF1778 family)
MRTLSRRKACPYPKAERTARHVASLVATEQVLYYHCEHMATAKDERLQIRVDPNDKALLERAAAASHLNVSAFVLAAAASKAEEVLAERQSIQLNPQAAAAFSEALERPASVNDRLAQALGRRRGFSWLD